MSKYYLGIDTSAYTTSVAVVDEENNIIIDLRKPLVVNKNQRGLRQQEAVFQHLNNLPVLLEELCGKIDFNQIDTISASSKPRNLNDSYMPVFIVGKNQAFILSKVLGKTYKEFSHQEGHIGAGLLDENFLPDEKFLAFHISGGTCEIVLVENKDDNLSSELLGGSLDISFGQLIDRIGVYLGLDFPCGREMDVLSKEGKLLKINIPLSIKNDLWSNLSGLENYFIKLIESKKYKNEDIIVTLFNVISVTIEKIILNSLEVCEVEKVLITGGVSANSYIRNYLHNSKRSSIKYLFPETSLSTDNAAGTAYLGKIKKGHCLECEI